MRFSAMMPIQTKRGMKLAVKYIKHNSLVCFGY